MTLRARLTGAFLAVVMGPVLLGGAFVAITVTMVNHSHERDRLQLAAGTAPTVIVGACDRLQAAAETAATTTVAGTQPARAQALVTRGLADGFNIENATGIDLVTTTGAPPPPWALCTPMPPSSNFPAYDASADGPYTALAAVVEMRNQSGVVTGYTFAAQALSPAFVAHLSTATGAQVTIVSQRAASYSTQSATDAGRIAAFAHGLTGSSVDEDHGRYVRRLDPSSEQPFTIALSVPVSASGSLLKIVIAVVVFAGIAALFVAWLLARTTTKPLDEITAAAGRIAGGDLAARVPVRHDDEVGHLGAAFNRMSRDMQSYATALTNSRDQLRGNLDVLGTTLASTHDLPRILQVILASAISATGCQAGVVLLLDPDDDVLRVQCAEGFDETINEFEIAPGEGLIGAVAASGVAQRGRPDALYSDGEPECRTYLAVPMRSPDADTSALPVGVLVLYDRLGDEEFGEIDLRTVRTFASHAAVAVDNVRAHAEAQRLSHTDPLTGLYNYRHLKDLVRREVDRSRRFNRTLCVMVLDLDRFKEVNDSYGHAAGDAVLVEFARRIGLEIRAVDLAFRYGGEEFVLLLPETDGLGGITLAQRLGAAIHESMFTVPGRTDGGTHVGVDVPIRVTVSIGVAVFPDHGSTGTHLLEAADDALYAAKAAGRDTYRLAISQPLPEVPVQPGTPEPPAAADDVEIGAATAGPRSSGGLARWRGRSAGRSSGGAPGATPPPRQAQGR